MITVNEKLGISIPEILLPGKGIDPAKWSVIACDQYTSQPEYWNTVEEFVGNSPSTLNLIFPEIYLEEDGKNKRIGKINETMKKYLCDNVLIPQKPGFIYLERTTSRSGLRKGLLIAVDLDKYDYNKGSRTLIRATEGTILERLPPRVKIRENASIELPHIMVLIDDPGKTVIEPLSQNTGRMEKLYDFDLMMGGGHLKGYKIEDEEIAAGILDSFKKLADPRIFASKYNVNSDRGILLFAVGDGNHSLASAKAHWENLKNTLAAEETAGHPARFALVEVVNVHDDGLKFEPIHRVVFNVNPDNMLDKMVDYFSSHNSKSCYKMYNSQESMQMKMEDPGKIENAHVIPFTAKGKQGIFIVINSPYYLEAGTLQSFLDEFIKTDAGIKIDYIHGEDVVDTLASREGNIGFFLPSIDKRDLFKTIILNGALPRKTFSMGEAEEKRFYLECRKIRK